MHRPEPGRRLPRLGPMSVELTAFLLSAGAACAALLGWVAVAARRTWTDRGVGIALLASAGGMLLISVVELLPPGLADPEARLRTLLLFGAGIGMVPLMRRLLAALLPSMGAAQSAALLVMLAIALHNIPEGAVPFTAAMVSLESGVITAVSIALHNIPEGMAVSSAALATGASRLRALAYTSVSTVGELAGAGLMLLVGRTLTPAASSSLLAVVAGVMVGLCATQLVPAGIGLVTGSASPVVEDRVAHSAHLA